MSQTKLNGVTITHWPTMGPLMFHWPEEATNATNNRFINTQKEDDSYGEHDQNREPKAKLNETPPDDGKRNSGNHDHDPQKPNLRPPTLYTMMGGREPKQSEDERTDANSNETHAQTQEQLVQEDAFEMCEKRAIRIFKRDMFQFLHTRGLFPARCDRVSRGIGN